MICDNLTHIRVNILEKKNTLFLDKIFQSRWKPFAAYCRTVPKTLLSDVYYEERVTIHFTT